MEVRKSLGLPPFIILSMLSTYKLYKAPRGSKVHMYVLKVQALCIRQPNDSQSQPTGWGRKRVAHLHYVPLSLEAPLHAAGNAVTAHSCGGWTCSLEHSGSLFVGNARAGSCVLLRPMRKDMKGVHNALGITDAEQAAAVCTSSCPTVILTTI